MRGRAVGEGGEKGRAVRGRAVWSPAVGVKL